MVLSGCGGGGAKSEPSASKEQAGEAGEAGEAGKKAELHVAIGANPPSLDPPSINSNIVGGVGSHIYEPLFALNKDFEPAPVLAESYEVSEDGKEYTIKLRQGVKFHNGNEMKADDVVASMNRWVKVSDKAKSLIEGSVFEKVDDYTVKMIVNKPSSDIITILASPIQFAAIYPAEIAESATAEGVDEYIGTGPYKLGEWKQDQYIRLERFDDYTASEEAPSGFTGKKEAATETIVFEIVTDTSTRIAGVQSGQYDVAEEIPADNYEQLAGNQDLKMEIKPGGSLNMFLNTTEGIMANEDMRQAILAALNCDDILLASYGNQDLYELNPGWFNPSDAQWGSEAGKEYYNQNDPDKAKELLKKAGYNNEKIVLVTTPDYDEMYNATIVVQEQLKKVGINAEVESYDFSTFMEHRADPKQFSIFITSNSYNVLPIQLFVLDKEWAGFDRKEVTDGISAIRDAASEKEASDEWQKLQSFLYEQGASTVIGHFTSIVAVRSEVEGFEYLRFPIYWNASVAE